MKLRFANVEGVEMLSRELLKTVLGGSGSGGTGGSGGGCCCEHHVSNGYDWYSCGKTKQEAISAAAASGGNWCCDSCPQSMSPCIP